jgi:hypothetical protein
MKSRLLFAAAMALVIGATCNAQDPVKDTEKAAHDAANATEKAAKKTAHATEKAADAAGTETKRRPKPLPTPPAKP